MNPERPAFLTAQWRHLVMLNYVVDPSVLDPYVPTGTTLDAWGGRHYVSVVAFRFLNTRIKGVRIPFHQNFDEINLRFYVGREGPDGWRRGVVFIKEVVPRWAIAAVARWVYNENYVACPTRSSINLPTGADGALAFSWRPQKMEELAVKVTVSGSPHSWESGSEAEFITEHYWGYAAQRNGVSSGASAVGHLGRSSCEAHGAGCQILRAGLWRRIVADSSVSVCGDRVPSYGATGAASLTIGGPCHLTSPCRLAGALVFSGSR